MNFALIAIQFVLATVMTSTTWAGGSRVGNGNSGDGNKSGSIRLDKSFEITIPSNFPQIREFKDGVQLEGLNNVKLKLGVLGQAPVITSSTINILRLREEMPAFLNMNKVEATSFLDQNKWTSYEVKSSCVLARYKKNDKIITALVTWGSGEGFLATAPNNNEGREALDLIATSTKPDSGNCEWK